MKVTLTDDKGQRRRSKVTKNELMVILHSPGRNVQYDKATSNDISLFDLDLRSRSQHKVKGHRGGGVCVL